MHTVFNLIFHHSRKNGFGVQLNDRIMYTLLVYTKAALMDRCDAEQTRMFPKFFWLVTYSSETEIRNFQLCCERVRLVNADLI